MTIERSDLSIDAIKINNEYFEDLNIGYKTIKSVGRELIDRDLETIEPIHDGSILRSSKYAAREIKVDFIIQRTTMALMRASMETLKKKLDVENVDVKFNGDSDYYYIGTPSLDNSIEEIWNGIIGTIIIHCYDPFKYSAEKTVAAAGGQFSFTYNGTYKTYPKLIAEFPATEDADGDNTDTSQCGYVGFVNTRNNILQFGDPEAVDWVEVQHEATVPINRVFKSKSGWTQNDSEGITGTVTGSVSANSTNKYIYPGGYGSGAGYHGPTLSKTITGETPPIGSNYKFTWKQKFRATDKQFGGIEIILWDNDNGTRALVSAVRILKTTKDTKCTVYLYTGDFTDWVDKFTVDVSKIGSCSMQKIDDSVIFKVGGRTHKITDVDITNLLANEVTFHFLQKASKTAVGSNYIYECKLQRTETGYDDIQNIFMPGQILTIDTEDASVFLDDGSASLDMQSIGALGNDWEDFYLTPGSNTIAIDYSDFTTTPPNFTLKYKERFL